MEAIKNNNLSRKNRVLKTVRYTVAALSAIIIMVVAYLLFAFYNLSAAKLYKDNYFSYNFPATTKQDSLIEPDIKKAFLEKNFYEVIQLARDKALNAQELFLVGLSYLEKDDAVKAISDFQVVIAEAGKTKSVLLKEEAEYYLAMASLKNRDYDQAIELMEKIHSNPAHTCYAKISSKLIRKIKILKWR